LLSNATKRRKTIRNAVTNLNAKTGISAHAEYQQLKRIVDDGRTIMDRACIT
jgi:hypothetical protein